MRPKLTENGLKATPELGEHRQPGSAAPPLALDNVATGGFLVPLFRRWLKAEDLRQPQP